jgi:copper(I)-binding protein
MRKGGHEHRHQPSLGPHVLDRSGRGRWILHRHQQGSRSRSADRGGSPAASKVEIHGIKVVGYGIRMRLLEKGLGLPADTAITLKPRGYHLFMEVKAPLAQGQKVPVTLTFEKAGTLRIELVVEAPGPVGNQTLWEHQPG